MNETAERWVNAWYAVPMGDKMVHWGKRLRYIKTPVSAAEAEAHMRLHNRDGLIIVTHAKKGPRGGWTNTFFHTNFLKWMLDLKFEFYIVTEVVALSKRENPYAS